MKTSTFIALSILLITPFLSIVSQTNTLSFNANGEFKILVLSDLHLDNKYVDDIVSEAKKLITEEKPDLVVLTGDNVSDTNPRELVGKLGYMLGYMKTPWVSILGNHDDESWPSRKDLAKIYSDQPLNLNSTIGSLAEMNFTLGIKNRSNKLESVIYLFNTIPDANLKEKNEIYQGVMLYSQVEWFRNQSSIFTKQNNNKPLNALAFAHIALPEYESLWQESKKSCVGIKSEDISIQAFNFGLFASMYEMGDVMGFFVGHDHKNNFVGTYRNIALGYANFSGNMKGVYGISASGARVILLKEGKREFESWIRTKDNKVLYEYTYFDNRAKESFAKVSH